jgi:hypothetical protein
MKYKTYSYGTLLSTVEFEIWLESKGISESRAEKIGDFFRIFLDGAWNNRIWGGKRRKPIIKIDYWDTWGAHCTLAPIILPLLIQLKETKTSAPRVDDEDVPANLKSTNALPWAEKDVGWESDIDSLYFARHEWIMDEMIWAFTQIVNNDAYGQFSSQSGIFKETIFGDMDDTVVDYAAMRLHNDRIQRGTTLFGKYFSSLWN